VTAGSLAAMDARAPSVHVALAGLLATAKRQVAELEPCWERCDASERARWTRDRALLTVAEKVRGLRAEAAWRALARSEA
jgi:hypothetical protein